MKRFLENRARIASALLPVFIPAMLAPGALNAQSTSTTTTTTTPIKHVVVIFQENVSFDHYFGTYPNAYNQTTGEPVFKASSNTPAVNGLSPALLTTNPNSAQPVRLTRAQAVTCDQDHNYTPEQEAADSGLMDKFVQYTGVGSGSCDIGYGPAVVMGYYDGNTVTAMWNYAQNYAMSDNSFDTTYGPSAPGVMHLIAGTSSGATLVSGKASGIMANGANSGTMIGDARPPLAQDDCTITTDTLVQMTGQNVGNLLNAKNITWGWFQGGFKPSSTTNGTAVCATAHNNISGASAGTDYIPHHNGFAFFPSTANPHHLPPTSVAAIGTTDQANHNYDMSDFMNALAAGNLPAVSFLKAPAYEDGHAGYSDPLDEQTFVVNTINAIMASPFWSSTAIIINYDDSDGWYDHVLAPVVSPSSVADDALAGPGNCGNGGNNAAQGRCGYGPRLPLLVISPYAKVNYVDHSVTDQSSILRFIEDNWNLGRIGNGSMDAVAGTINDMFNFNGAPAAPAVYLSPSTGLVTSAPTNTGGSGTGSTATTTAVINPQNATVTVNQIQLNASASTSYDGKPLTYTWTLASGSLPASITGGNTATPTVQFTEPGPYTIMLTVTDDAGKTATATTTINYVN